MSVDHTEVPQRLAAAPHLCLTGTKCRKYFLLFSCMVVLLLSRGLDSAAPDGNLGQEIICYFSFFFKKSFYSCLTKRVEEGEIFAFSISRTYMFFGWPS